jgi:hypothetical protein
MKIDTVRTCTLAANDLALALESDANLNITSPVTITATYLDTTGRVINATHVVGIPGWTFRSV